MKDTKTVTLEINKNQERKKKDTKVVFCTHQQNWQTVTYTDHEKDSNY